jgi:NADH dehydrogenase
MQKTPKINIVIIGAGFAGISTYQNLCKHIKDDTERYSITFITKNNHFLFTPLLHEVATGALNYSHVTEPLRKLIAPHTDIYLNTVTKINPVEKIVSTDKRDFSYDYLIIAAGATTQFFNTPGAKEHTYTLKTVDDAELLRNKIIKTFESATRLHDEKERREKLSFTIVGGGATGVEVAAEMAEFMYGTLQKYYQKYISREDICITLITHGSQVLEQFKESLRPQALKTLHRHGVRTLLNTKVEEVTADSVTIHDGEILPSSITVWAAGVTPNQIPSQPELTMEKSGRIIVNEYLQAETYPDIFVLGDTASMITPEHPHGLPMLAQVATQQGKVAAHNIMASIHQKSLKKFSFNHKGELVSLGQWNALGSISGIGIRGLFAWFVWRTVYLMNFSSWRKRIKIAIDWTINIFTERDITTLK